MAETQKEVFRYELDISDVEAKAARLQQLVDQIKAKKGRGEDTTEIEAQLSREMDGIARLRREQQQQDGVVKDLTKNKEKLANVVALLGGRFGGLVGQLGGVVELLAAGGKAALGFGVAMAAVTGVTAIYRAIRSEMERIVNAQKEWNASVAEQQRGKLGAQQEITAALAASGQASEETVGAAMALYGAGRKQFGIKDARLAGLATAAGVTSADDLAVLGMMQNRGIQIGGADDVSKLLGRARKRGEYGAWLGEAGAYAGTAAAQEEIAAALVPGAGGRGERSREEMLFDEMIAAGKIARGTDREKFISFAKQIREPADVNQQIDAEVSSLGAFSGRSSADYSFLLQNEDQLRSFVALRNQLQASGGGAAAGTTINVTNYNVGTMFNGPDRRHSGRGNGTVHFGGGDVRSGL